MGRPHSVDLVISDAPVGAGVKVKAYSHLLGETPVAFFGSEALASKHGQRFPRSLDGAPVLLPTEGSSLRRSLDQWLHAEGIRPRVVGEIEDSALLKVFGQSGVGLFPAPVAIEAEVRAQFGVRLVGRIDAVTERFYAISAERKIQHPAVIAISETARHDLFGRWRVLESAPKR